MSDELDAIIRSSLAAFARDVLDSAWWGKEHDWVSRYAFNYLINLCSPEGPLRHPGQIAIEVGVAQPPGMYKAGAVGRDLVIWSKPGSSCWDRDWKPSNHPIAVLEWKVHRQGHRNRRQAHEREWLKRYTEWQPSTVAYAVEINLGKNPSTLKCARFLAGSSDDLWLELKGSGRSAG